MYYQQYNMYKQGWYGGYQPSQHLSCMYEDPTWQHHVFPQQQTADVWEEPNVVISSPLPPAPDPPATHRPAPARSPYEWMKKPSYHSQPNPDSIWRPTSPEELQRAANLSKGKTRTKDKYRVVYTDQQRLELEKEFHYSRYITIRRKTELAISLGLSERQVKIWFQNRRAKERKQAKKREELLSKEKIHHLSML